MTDPSHYLLTLLCALLTVPMAGAQTTKVFRCVGEFGRIEFRQGPCITGTQEELLLKDEPVGWEAPKHKVTIKRKPTNSPKRVIKSSGKSAQQCFKTEQRLETVNRKLRRGYKAGKGADLRHKRRQYEAYLSQFCK